MVVDNANKLNGLRGNAEKSQTFQLGTNLGVLPGVNDLVKSTSTKGVSYETR